MAANVLGDSVEFNQANFPAILESLVAAYKEAGCEVLVQELGAEGME